MTALFASAAPKGDIDFATVGIAKAMPDTNQSLAFLARLEAGAVPDLTPLRNRDFFAVHHFLKITATASTIRAKPAT